MSSKMTDIHDLKDVFTNIHQNFLPLNDTLVKLSDKKIFRAKVTKVCEKMRFLLEKMVHKDFSSQAKASDVWDIKDEIRSVLYLLHKCHYKCELELDDESDEESEINDTNVKEKIQLVEKLQIFCRDGIRTLEKMKKEITIKLQDVDSEYSLDSEISDSDFSYDSMDDTESDDY